MGKKVELHKGYNFDLLKNIHTHTFKSYPCYQILIKTNSNDDMMNCWRAAVFLGQERALARNPRFLTHPAIDMAFTFQYSEGECFGKSI